MSPQRKETPRPIPGLLASSPVGIRASQLGWASLLCPVISNHPAPQYGSNYALCHLRNHTDCQIAGGASAPYSTSSSEGPRLKPTVLSMRMVKKLLIVFPQRWTLHTPPLLGSRRSSHECNAKSVSPLSMAL